MKTLEHNMISIHGQKGQQWLDSLPSIIKDLSQSWSLSDVKAVSNLSYNYVALANAHKNMPVALKISCDPRLFENEYMALQHFNGSGSIKVIDINEKYNALLLQQASPGKLLKARDDRYEDQLISHYAAVVKRIASKSLTHKSGYTHVREWVDKIAKINNPIIDKRYVEKACSLGETLLASAQDEYLCHGDLHCENIISHHDSWLSIDPKGVVGEMAFEASAMDLLAQQERASVVTVSSLIVKRVTMLADCLQLNKERLLAWMFLRIMISAQWFIEDGGDPSNRLLEADIIYPLLKDFI